MTRLCLFLLTLAATASSQETWHGLRFGMTEAEARTVLGSQAARPGKTKQTQESDPVYSGWVLATKIEQMPATAEVMFDKKTRRLHDVLLDIDLRVKDEEKRFRIRWIMELLQNKYGTPFRSDDESFTKETVWRTKEQVITCIVIGANGMPDLLLVKYEPVTGDL